MEELIPASEYAARYGFTEQAVIYKIRQGIVQGTEREGSWYVLLNPSPSPTESQGESAEGGGQSDSLRATQVEYQGRAFIGSIASVVAVLLAYNIFALFQGYPASIIPIVFQSTILVLIYLKHPWVIWAVKAWAVLLLIGGGFKLLSIVLKAASYNILDSSEALADVSIGTVFFALLQLGVGIPCVVLVPKYIKLVAVQPTEASEPTIA